MSSIKVKLDLSKQQLSKLRSAKKHSKAVSIRFSNDQIFKESGHEIEVSPEQYKKLLSASKSKAKRGCVLSFSTSQVQSNPHLWIKDVLLFFRTRIEIISCSPHLGIPSCQSIRPFFFIFINHRRPTSQSANIQGPKIGLRLCIT